MAEPDSALMSGCSLWVAKFPAPLGLLPTCREVWFLLELISGLIPSWYWDCSQLVEVGGDEGQKATDQGKTRSWCSGEGAGSSRLYALRELLPSSACRVDRPMREQPETAGSEGLKR